MHGRGQVKRTLSKGLSPVARSLLLWQPSARNDWSILGGAPASGAAGVALPNCNPLALDCAAIL